MEMRPVGLQELDPVVDVPVVGTRASSSMREANMLMRQVSGSFARSDPIAFFCECRIPTCYSVVWMSAPVFDANVEGGAEWLLSHDHEPSGPRPMKQTGSGSDVRAHVVASDEFDLRGRFSFRGLRNVGDRYLRRTRVSTWGT
jgi:hypothetical protein